VLRKLMNWSGEKTPQVVIVDMEPEVDIIGLILKLKAIVQDSKIILLSGFADTERTREAFASGVDGIVLKVQPPAVLIAAIECLCPTPTMLTHEPTVMDGLTVAGCGDRAPTGKRRRRRDTYPIGRGSRGAADPGIRSGESAGDHCENNYSAVFAIQTV
jgi:CheY-like chemotaxis protein